VAVTTHHPAESPMKAPPTKNASANLRPPDWLLPIAVALLLVLAVASAGVVVFGLKAASGFSTERGRTDVLAAARDVAARITTFDATSAEADTQRLLELTTPQFAQGFAGDKDGFIKLLRQGKTKMSGQVTDAGVLSYDGEVAQVLVTVRAQITDVRTPQGQARDYRMELTMLDQGRWLANAVEFDS
jgi:Mce-associated membrane protein